MTHHGLRNSTILSRVTFTCVTLSPSLFLLGLPVHTRIHLLIYTVLGYSIYVLQGSQ